MAATNPNKSLADFGEVPGPTNANTGLRSTKVKGNTRLLTITELTRVQNPDGSVDFTAGTAQAVFQFARENFSAPRGPQTFSLKLRTARQDLPGGEEPVEQVLGWNYEPFTVQGVWDDRHAGQGYAETTRRRFEDMVKRGNMVKYQFEQVSIRGIITAFNVNWKRADLQAYTFTISPHYRYPGETVRVDPSPPNLKKASTVDPKTAVANTRAVFTNLLNTQSLVSLNINANVDLSANVGINASINANASINVNASANASASIGANATVGVGINANSQVRGLLKTSAFADISTDLDSIDSSITYAETVTQNEILNPTSDPTNALSRGAQSMASVKTAIANLLTTTRNINSADVLASSSLVTGLQFENWIRSTSSSALVLATAADDCQAVFNARANPQPTRLHRVRGGESLYQISTLYYGSPFHWREILLANDLSSLVLTGGELLTIPQIKLTST